MFSISASCQTSTRGQKRAHVGQSFPSISSRPDELSLECPVCLEQMTEPKVLHCGHNLCVECMGNVQTQGVGCEFDVKCPECRRVSKLARGMDLATNYALRDLAQKAQELKRFCESSCNTANRSTDKNGSNAITDCDTGSKVDSSYRETFELRLLISSMAAEAVIGKGDEYIKAVRKKFNANIDLPDRHTPERVLVITCNKDRVHDCFGEILPKLAVGQREDEVEIRILVHQSQAAVLVCTKKIKEVRSDRVQLKERAQCTISVYNDCAPSSSDRVVSIVGTQDKLLVVVRFLVDFMIEVPAKGPSKPYDASNYVDPRVLDCGGYVPDLGSSWFSRGGYMDYDMPCGGPRGGPIAPSLNPFWLISGILTSIVTGADVSPLTAGGYSAGRPPMVGGYIGGGQQLTVSQVSIPNALGGTIFGFRGERINRIRQDSGARIDIGAACENDERTITIWSAVPDPEGSIPATAERSHQRGGSTLSARASRLGKETKEIALIARLLRDFHAPVLHITHVPLRRDT